MIKDDRLVSPLKWQNAENIYKWYFEQQADFYTWFEFNYRIIQHNYSQISLENEKSSLVVILKRTNDDLYIKLTDASCFFGNQLTNLTELYNKGSWARIYGMRIFNLKCRLYNLFARIRVIPRDFALRICTSS